MGHNREILDEKSVVQAAINSRLGKRHSNARLEDCGVAYAGVEPYVWVRMGVNKGNVIGYLVHLRPIGSFLKRGASE